MDEFLAAEGAFGGVLEARVKKLLPGWLEIMQLAHDGDNARKEENTLFKEYEE